MSAPPNMPSGPPSDQILAPGVVLAERFRIEQPVGRGSNGVVYRAVDERLGEAIALKTLRGDEHDPRRLKGLLRELQLARRVTHHNVCRLHDLVETDFQGHSLLLLSMELLEGLSLRTLLHRRGRLSSQESLAILRQVAAGLDAAHSAGVIHGDLSARNLFALTTDGDEIGRVVITDFGLARSISRAQGLAGADPDTLSETTDEELAETLTEQIAGTPAYMAPELLRGQAPSIASDIYALGVLAFEMRSGDLPFQGGSSFETALRRLVSDPPTLTETMPGIESSWNAPIAAAMAREPEDRPASAGAFVSRLPETATTGVLATVSSGGAGRRWLIAAALLVVVGAAWFFSRTVSPGPTSSAERPRDELSSVTIGTAEASSAPSLSSARLAVLPFEHDESGPASYLAYGLAEAVHQSLTEFRHLGVFSPASALMVSRQLHIDDGDDARSTLARDFGLRYLVRGTVSLQSDARANSDAAGLSAESVTVQVELMDLESDSSRRSEPLRRPLEQAFELQTRVAAELTGWLRRELPASPTNTEVDEPSTRDLQAYQDYARGLQSFYGTYGIGGVSERRAGLERARTLFDRAAARDPEFVDALAWSAMSDYNESLLPGARPGLLDSAKSKAEAVLESRPESTEANALLGYITGIRGDLAGAERYFAAALAQSPGSAWPRGLRAQLLERAQLWQEAAQEAATAAELDPFNPIMLQLAAGSFLVLRNYQRANDIYTTAIERFPEHPLFYGGLAVNQYYWTGDAAASRAILDQTPASPPGDYLTAWLFMIERDWRAALDELAGIAEPIWDGDLYQPKELLRAYCLQQLKRSGDANAALRAALEAVRSETAPSAEDPRLATTEAAIYALQGDAIEARSALSRAVRYGNLEQDPLYRPALTQAVAWVHALLGERQQAITWLDLLFEGPANISAAALVSDPRWDGLRQEASFTRLLDKARRLEEEAGSSAGSTRR